MHASHMVLGHPVRRFLALAIDACLCAAIYCALTTAGASGARLSIFFIAAGWAVFALPTASRLGGSLGTRLAGLVVTDSKGERVRIVRASCRAFLSVLSAGIFGMGYMLLFFTRKRQTLHDLYTNTLVLDAKATMSRIEADTEGDEAGKAPSAAGADKKI